jgi:hypothetical protein
MVGLALLERLCPVALSDAEGTATLFAQSGHIGDSRLYDPGDPGRAAAASVQVMTLDHVLAQLSLRPERVVIKLDAQGMEPAILRGAARLRDVAVDALLLTEIQPAILKEAGSSVDAYLDQLRGAGWVPVELAPGLARRGWDGIPRHGQKDYAFRRTAPIPELRRHAVSCADA